MSETPEDYIASHCTTEELLYQCAEECAELTKACLKLIRFNKGNAANDIAESVLKMDVCEETADVLVCIERLIDKGIINEESMSTIYVTKKERWAKRIKEREEQ